MGADGLPPLAAVLQSFDHSKWRTVVLIQMDFYCADGAVPRTRRKIVVGAIGAGADGAQYQTSLMIGADGADKCPRTRSAKPKKW